MSGADVGQQLCGLEVIRRKELGGGCAVAQEAFDEASVQIGGIGEVLAAGFVGEGDFEQPVEEGVVRRGTNLLILGRRKELALSSCPTALTMSLTCGA